MYSNAAIGGAATAATMAASIARPNLVYYATLMGILGYIIGTPIGLTLLPKAF